MFNDEEIICGDLVKLKENYEYGVVVVSFAQCCGVRFKNSNEVKIVMFDALEKVK